MGSGSSAQTYKLTAEEASALETAFQEVPSLRAKAQQAGLDKEVIFQPILQKLQQSRGDLKASLKGLLDDLEKDESKKLEAKLKALEPQAEADKEKFMSTWKELAHEIDILCKDEKKMMNDLVAWSGSRKKTEARVLDALQAVEVVASKTASTAAASAPAEKAADPAQVAADAAAAECPAICVAARDGDLAAVRGFLRADAAAWRRCDVSGWTPLHHAARSLQRDGRWQRGDYDGYVEMVELLLAAGAPVDGQTNHGVTPLHIAVACHDIAMAKVLLAAGASPLVKDNDGETPLDGARGLGQNEMCRLLEAADPAQIAADAAAAAKWEDRGSTPAIGRAVHAGDLAAVRGFLRADPAAWRICESDGVGPLHDAAARSSQRDYDDYVEVARVLLEAGAPVDAQNKHGKTPLHIAAEKYKVPVAKLLVAARASPLVKDERGETPLDIARQLHLPEIITLLEEVVASKTASAPAEKAADPAQVEADAAAAAKWEDSEAVPGICRAARHGDLAAVRGFLRADPAAARRRDDNGGTPLHYAAMFDHAEVAELLLAAGAPVDGQNKYGQTPLHDAAANDSIAVAKVLLAAGASPHVKDNHGETPLDKARDRGYSEMVSLLEA